MVKSTKTQARAKKRTQQPHVSTDARKQIWIFDSVDNDGDFRFAPGKEHSEQVLDKIVHYSKRKWSEIKSEGHGAEGKSKHHYLDFDSLSPAAKKRVDALCLNEDDKESIFSMRLEGKIRIIGLRDGEKFIVKWFDPNHGFCPSTKR